MQIRLLQPNILIGCGGKRNQSDRYKGSKGSKGDTRLQGNTMAGAQGVRTGTRDAGPEDRRCARGTRDADRGTGPWLNIRGCKCTVGSR